MPVMQWSDVHAARERIRDGIHLTPLLSSRLLGERAGGEVFLKAENLQRVGAFKFRGALNAVRSLPSSELVNGVSTYSSGNHGQAVALAARGEGTRAILFMPEDTPKGKVEAARAYGAEVRFAGTTSTHRQAACEEGRERGGYAIIPPFDDPRIIAGQGTVGLEILEQLPSVERVLVPVGGGGILSGVALALADRGVEVIGVEPESANAMQRALAAGHPVEIPVPDTIADGLRSLQVGDLPFEVVRDRVREVITVTDGEILVAMEFLLTRARLVVEPSGAVGVAAILAGKIRFDGLRGVVILTGGNASPQLLSRLLADS